MKEIIKKSNNIEEITERVVKLIKTIRYTLPRRIKVKTEDLVMQVTKMFKETKGFIEEIERKETLSEMSKKDIISIISIILSILEK